MKSLSLSTRLFLSCFAVSALLFAGIYFYVKGFMENQGFEQSRLSFERSERHYRALLRARGASIDELAYEMASSGRSALFRAELEAAGLTFVTLKDGHPHVSGVPLTPDDAREFARPFGAEPSLVTLTSGRYLVRKIPAPTELLILFPLFDLDRSAHELLRAFLVAGAALLLLTTILAQLLSREISRPLVQLRDRVRLVAEHIGLAPPPEGGDEVGAIANSYLEFAQHLQTAFEHKKLALEELESYKAELLRVNGNLHRRLFQVKVLLSLWSGRDQALDVKDFLSHFLEALLPGLPFEYGCVIIRPIADMGSESIFAKKVPGEDGEKDGALCTEVFDRSLQEFLHRESSHCLGSQDIRVSAVTGSLREGAEPSGLTVLSFRLQQGDEPLGSVHFITDQPSPPPVPAALTEFLLSLSAQVSAQLQIKALSFATRLDPLTRLYNRGYLNDRLREEIVRCSRKHESFSLVLLDIDHFHRLSENHGRQAADEALRGVASLLKAKCRGSDAVCRYEGSVLALVLADTPASGAKIVAENMRRAVESQEFPVPGGSLRVTVSLGIADFPSDGDGLEALRAQAERALASAKEAGRNSWKAA